MTFACGVPVIVPNPSYVDACGSVATVVTTVNGSVVDLSTYTFPVGTTTVCFAATDACGNTTNDCISVTVSACATNCNTAYGYNAAISSCFMPKFSNWGWTNNVGGSGSYTLDLYAGNPSCTPIPDRKVGTVLVVYSGSNVTLTYNITKPNYSMSEVHAYVGCGMYPVKKLQHRDNTHTEPQDCGQQAILLSSLM
jgi:hypothetical protein